MSKNRQIAVTWFEFHSQTKVFNDWYDVADWLKQRELAKKMTIIIGWMYV